MATTERASAEATERKTIRAAVVGAEPFVVREGSERAGVSVEIFREVARIAGLEVELVPMTSVPSALDAVARREVDVAVGPISITANRLERARFTQPYFHSSLGILTPHATGWLSRVSGFLTKAFAVGLAVLMFVLVGVGTLVWLAERKTNPEHFPPRPLAGIANGVWFALVTMTTVGYGDRVPTTLAGRVVAGAWMIVALLTASSLTAGIATAITVAQLVPPAIASADQLSGRRVAVVRDTPAVAFAQRARARIVLVNSLDDAVALVLHDEADAAIFDRPMLRYQLTKNPELPLVVSEGSYAPQGYGFAVADPELQHRLNVALLRASEEGILRRVNERWLGRSAEEE